MRAADLRISARRPRTAPGPAAVRQRAEAAASRLPPLMVAAEQVAATVAQGVHGRRRVGQGETFWQFRRYVQGDPIQRIDWRQSAKRQRVFIRENEWEAAQSVWLWLDRSSSMGYASARDLPEKSERAAILTLALASLLVRGGERVSLLGSGLPPASGRAVLDRVAAALAAPDDGAPSLPPVEQLPRHARLVLVSDFLSPADDIAAVLHAYAGFGLRGHLLQICDPAEETLPFSGRVRFEGMEGEGAALIGSVEAVRGDYVELMRAHRVAVSDAARGIDWSWTAHRTDQPPQTALLALYLALAAPVGG